MKHAFLWIPLAVFALACGGDDKHAESPAAESAAESEKAAEEAKDKAEDAAEESKDKADDAADTVKEGTEKPPEKVE